jgi:hypothetical protein
MNGADASTTFTDERGHTFTAAGNAQIDTAQSKFGGSSLRLDGTGDYISAPDSDDWDFGIGDFTVEFFIRFDGAPTKTVTSLIGNYASSTSGWLLQFRTDAPGQRLRFRSSGDSPAQDFTWTPAADTWYHIAVSRASGIIKVFVDGAQVGADFNNPEDISGSTAPLVIGSVLGFSQEVNGWFDEVRITKGVARDLSVAPTAPFPDS